MVGMGPGKRPADRDRAGVALLARARRRCREGLLLTERIELLLQLLRRRTPHDALALLRLRLALDCLAVRRAGARLGLRRRVLRGRGGIVQCGQPGRGDVERRGGEGGSGIGRGARGRLGFLDRCRGVGGGERIGGRRRGRFGRCLGLDLDLGRSAVAGAASATCGCASASLVTAAICSGSVSGNPMVGTWSRSDGVGSTAASGSARNTASTGWAGSEACANTCSCGPFRQDGLLTYCSWVARSSAAAPRPNTRMEVDSRIAASRKRKPGSIGRVANFRPGGGAGAHERSERGDGTDCRVRHAGTGAQSGGESG